MCSEISWIILMCVKDLLMYLKASSIWLYGGILFGATLDIRMAPEGSFVHLEVYSVSLEPSSYLRWLLREATLSIKCHSDVIEKPYKCPQRSFPKDVVISLRCIIPLRSHHNVFQGIHECPSKFTLYCTSKTKHMSLVGLFKIDFWTVLMYRRIRTTSQFFFGVLNTRMPLGRYSNMLCCLSLEASWIWLWRPSLTEYPGAILVSLSRHHIIS